MTASPGFLSALVTIASVLATVTPVILVVLWIRDARKRRLW